MSAKGTPDATAPVTGEVPPDDHYLSAAQRAWLALAADIPVGVLTLATIHVTDSGPAPSALIQMLYVSQSHRGTGIATRLLESARAAMTPRTVQHDGMRSEAGLRFVQKHEIPQCPCTKCATKPFSAADACTQGKKELARAVDAWESGNRQLLSAADSAAVTAKTI